jgi:hypothetical protein
VYPLLQDEMCWFLAIDFDKANWHDDANAFLKTCSQLSVNAALERSRSGRGGHVWLFFEEAIPAALARRLGSHLLTETMERRPDLGFDSYDRLFPSQDTLPQGGFGNLIALPPQEDGDEEPWAAPPFRRSREPALTGELPTSIDLVLGNQIYIAKAGLSPALRNRLLRVAAFQNPEFYKTQAMRLSSYDKPFLWPSFAATARSQQQTQS